MVKAKNSNIEYVHTYNPSKRLPDPPKDPSKTRRWTKNDKVQHRMWSGWKPVEEKKDTVTEAFGHKLMEKSKEEYMADQRAKTERNRKRAEGAAMQAHRDGLRGRQVVTKDGKTVLGTED